MRSKTAAFLVVSVAGLGLLHACHGHDEGTAGPEGVIYQGGATDEAIVVLLGAAPKSGGSPPMFTAPSAGQMVAAATPLTFAWTRPMAAAPSPFAPDPHAQVTDQGAPRRSPWRRLLDLTAVFSVRPALAHEPPFNGQAYYLRVVANDKEILKVFTANRSYTPSTEAWDRLKSAGGELRATLVSALYEKNRITSDGGPFEAAPVTFKIAP